MQREKSLSYYILSLLLGFSLAVTLSQVFAAFSILRNLMNKHFIGTSVWFLLRSAIAVSIVFLIAAVIINSRRQESLEPANKPSPTSIKPQALPLTPSQLDELAKTMTPSADAKRVLDQNQKQELLHSLTPSPQAKPALTNQELRTIFRSK